MQNQILGLREIAPLLEVDKRTPHAWLFRKLLPNPDYDSINGLRAWDRDTIITWAALTGRLPNSLHCEATTEIRETRGLKNVKESTVETTQSPISL